MSTASDLCGREAKGSWNATFTFHVKKGRIQNSRQQRAQSMAREHSEKTWHREHVVNRDLGDLTGTLKLMRRI
jgi:hypothetical protein